MEPKDNGREFRKISIQWVQPPEGWNDSNSPLNDPELIKAISELVNQMNLDFNQVFDDEEEMSSLQLELDNLEDIDNMVNGDDHPVALRLIMDAVNRVRDAGES